MDKKLTYKATQLEQMLSSLNKSITKHAKKLSKIAPDDHEAHEELDMFRDSIIQRLEYSVDHFWKSIKTYLEIAHGVAINENGPKSIARTATLHRIISEQESDALIDMVERRNKTSHIYKEEVADEFAKYAPKALAFMKTVLERLLKNISK